MLSRPSLHHLLLCMLRHLLPALVAVLGARAVELRARLAALPAGHRRRARMLGELRRLARWRALLAEPELLDDPAFRGKAAEVARVRNDAGRRALARRWIYPTPCRRLSGAAEAALCRAEEQRCRIGIAVA